MENTKENTNENIIESNTDESLMDMNLGNSFDYLDTYYFNSFDYILDEEQTPNKKTTSSYACKVVSNDDSIYIQHENGKDKHIDKATRKRELQQKFANNRPTSSTIIKTNHLSSNSYSNNTTYANPNLRTSINSHDIMSTTTTNKGKNIGLILFILIFFSPIIFSILGIVFKFISDLFFY